MGRHEGQEAAADVVEIGHEAAQSIGIPGTMGVPALTIHRIEAEQLNPPVLDELGQGLDHAAVLPARARGVALGEDDGGTAGLAIDDDVEVLVHLIAVQGAFLQLHEASSLSQRKHRDSARGMRSRSPSIVRQDA